jgi:hypothetical protein
LFQGGVAEAAFAECALESGSIDGTGVIFYFEEATTLRAVVDDIVNVEARTTG